MWPDSDSFIDWNWGQGLPKTCVVMVFEVEADDLQRVLFQNALRRMHKDKDNIEEVQTNTHVRSGGSWGGWWDD